jgi:hypothetical protein
MRGRKVNNEILKKMQTLRSLGYSVPEISKLVDTPKTTVLHHVKNVKILPEHIENWAGKRGGSRKKKLLQERLAFENGKKLVDIPSTKEKKLFIAALYWAEGSKKDFGLSNTDPDLIKLFVHGLREVFNIRNERLRVSVRTYEDLDREVCLDFWSKIVGIEKDKFVNVNVLPGKKKGKLLYGMCRVRVTKGATLLKEIIGINKAMTESMSP